MLLTLILWCYIASGMYLTKKFLSRCIIFFVTKKIRENVRNVSETALNKMKATFFCREFPLFTMFKKKSKKKVNISCFFFEFFFPIDFSKKWLFFIWSRTTRNVFRTIIKSVLNHLEDVTTRSFDHLYLKLKNQKKHENMNKVHFYQNMSQAITKGSRYKVSQNYAKGVATSTCLWSRKLNTGNNSSQ